MILLVLLMYLSSCPSSFGNHQRDQLTELDRIGSVMNKTMERLCIEKMAKTIKLITSRLTVDPIGKTTITMQNFMKNNVTEQVVRIDRLLKMRCVGNQEEYVYDLITAINALIAKVNTVSYYEVVSSLRMNSIFAALVAPLQQPTTVPNRGGVRAKRVKRV